MQGLFADVVQLALGLVAVSTLVFKRYRERPRRPWRIWFMDVSKQGLGALFAHILNLFLSALLSWNSTCSDERAWYAMNFVVDVTVGVVLNIAMLKMLRVVAYRCNWNSLKISGDYGRPPRLRVWWLQLSSWMVIVLASKAFLAVIMYMFEGAVSEFGCWAMSPVADKPRLELVLVMVVGPYILNAIQFWILDNFLKKNVTPHALREVRHAMQRNRAGSGGPLSPSRAREIRMSKVTARRDDEQLLLSATPPDVEQDAATLAALVQQQQQQQGHPSGRRSGNISINSAGDFSSLASDE